MYYVMQSSGFCMLIANNFPVILMNRVILREREGTELTIRKFPSSQGNNKSGIRQLQNWLPVHMEMGS